MGCIEKLFFDLLVKESETPKNDITILNEDFEEIKKLFEQYLSSINTENIKRNQVIHEAIFYRNNSLLNEGLDSKNGKY